MDQLTSYLQVEKEGSSSLKRELEKAQDLMLKQIVANSDIDEILAEGKRKDEINGLKVKQIELDCDRLREENAHLKAELSGDGGSGVQSEKNKEKMQNLEVQVKRLELVERQNNVLTSELEQAKAEANQLKNIHVKNLESKVATLQSELKDREAAHTRVTVEGTEELENQVKELTEKIARTEDGMEKYNSLQD